jgi:peptidoglycan/LPS O-acetylase OafA/YrhL
MLSVGLVLRSDSVFLVSVSDILPKWFFPVRLFWFALGMTFIMYISRITPVIRRMRWWLLIGAVGTFLIGVLEWEWLLRASGQLWAPHRETLVDSFFTLFVILGILAFSEIRIPLANQLMEIGARSYGIYLVHPPVMEYFSRGIYHLAPALLSYQIFLQSSLIFVGLAIPLGMMYFVRRSRARSLYPILFG